MGGSTKSFLKLISSHKRGAAIRSILFAHFLGDGDPLVSLVEFLVGALFTEDRIEVLWGQRLPGSWMKERKGLVRHDGLDVEKMRRNL